MNASSWVWRSSTDVKLPRLSRRRTRMRNQTSTWCSHEVCLGVNTNRIRWLGAGRNAARVGIEARMPATPLLPERVGQGTVLGHQSDPRLRRVGGAVVKHEHPRGRWV